MTERLLLLGAGGHAAVVADAARAAGWSIVGYLDDGAGPHALDDLGIPARGRPADLDAVLARLGPTAVHAAVGDPERRRAWSESIAPDRRATVVHPGATVSDHARLEAGAFIGAAAVVHARAVVGAGAIVNTGAIVEHDCILGPWSHVAPGAVLGGAVEVGPAALVGLRAAVLPGIRIGAGATVGAGAVVVSDVPDRATVTGVPARS